ncbi:MAG: hypothetical protein AABZ77_00830, partial [Chloroflexota bacterium]
MRKNPIWSSQDIEKLASCLDKLPPVDKKDEANDATAIKLLDCVLSLHRRYDVFVVPRIDTFKKSHPDVDTLLSLHKCVVRCGGPLRFYNNELDYDYEDAAQMFSRVLDYLINEIKKYPGNSEIEKCQRWAISASIDG